MIAPDAFFYLLALAAVAGSLSAALAPGLRRAAWSLVFVSGTLAGLFALLGAPVVATLQAGVVIAAAAALEHFAPRHSGGEATATATDAPVRLWRATLPVLALLVLLARAVLMARWPLSAAASASRATARAAFFGLPAVGLAHYLVTALLLFSIGLLASVTRRSVAGVAVGIQLMSGAAVLAIVAFAHSVGDGSDARMLAALVVAVSALRCAVVARAGAIESPSIAAQRLAGALATVLAGLTLALLAGAR